MKILISITMLKKFSVCIAHGLTGKKNTSGLFSVHWWGMPKCAKPHFTQWTFLLENIENAKLLKMLLHRTFIVLGSVLSITCTFHLKKSFHSNVCLWFSLDRSSLQSCQRQPTVAPCHVLLLFEGGATWLHKQQFQIAASTRNFCLPLRLML